MLSGADELLEAALFRLGGGIAFVELIMRLSALLFNVFGSARLIGGLGTDASGINEEADDLSDRRLLVRAMDLSDGSELAEETEGESLLVSGEDT